jgi:hypothetical protein
MAKLTADEFIKKYSEGEKKITESDDLLIELMEDAQDSIGVDAGESEEVEQLKAEIEKLSADNADLKERYKNRCLSSDADVVIEKEEEIEEPQEREIIDIKEI